jgi:hypothetical protein
MCCSSTQRRRAFAGRHVFVLKSSSGLRGHKRTYLTILESADHALFKMVRYVLLRPLWPELDAKTKTCLPAKTRFCHLDEQATTLSLYSVESTARAVTILMQQLKNYVRLLDNFILVKMFNLLS